MDNLFLLILTPLIGAIFLLFVCQHTVAKRGTLILSLITLGLTIPFICQFNASGDFNYEQSYQWISALGVNFHIGIDGISLPLLVLTNVLMPLIVLTTFKKTFKGNFYALMFFMQSGLMLVFSAMDAFTFYVGWEVALIPIYFICALWGDGDRIRVNLKFFIYTFFGSLLMLIAILYLHQQVPTHDFEWHSFVSLDLDASTQRWIFWAFFIAFAIKIPIFPFHTWQPNTYTHAPAAGTMLLAGIMLKMGIYGLMRWLLPVVPEGVALYGHFAMILCVIGIVYASIIAIQQQDAKRIVAYSSIAHVGLISAGVFAWNVTGMGGAMIQMINHGISVIGLFFVLDIIQDRTGSRDLKDLGGIATKAPRLAVLFLIIVMGAIGLPLTNGFIGEFLLLKSVYEYGVWFALFAGLTLILGAVYMLRLYQKTMLGTTSDRTENFTDIRGMEFYTLVIISGLIIYLGIFPNSLLHISSESVSVLATFLGR
ncbi:NADH-quinone oxidoreductase subunit M [Sphingobacterium sp. SRCM116780]|uniref:complex I subunit 4 family protein n=1 Tax=Sphingobacterium sp. SRCM116780 TaxID=2907623 RepID=UPI001F2B7FBC|nr:NADH-quinone oxidoreductase subunit M [Sphingobacterium sp. SRCM116780]UIR55876.1 NADH-quinone oxidoreductase subunit M [Sphingobacterium sp. SRCM116780]